MESGYRSTFTFREDFLSFTGGSGLFGGIVPNYSVLLMKELHVVAGGFWSLEEGTVGKKLSRQSL